MAKSKRDIQPYWRPNFVNTSGLPDIKVVRTNFIVNSVAFTLLICIGFVLVQKEYKAFSLKRTIAGLEERVQLAEGEDKAYLRLNQKFRKAAENVVEMEKFYVTPFFPHEFLSEVSLLRPDGLIFNQVSVLEKKGGTKATAKQVVYEVVVSGEVRTLTALDEFKSKVSDWDLLAVEGYVSEIEETVQGRNAQTGIFPYSLRIIMTPGKNEDKSKEGGAS